MRASLENVLIFAFWNSFYIYQYYVGTSDTLLVQMTCLLAYIYQQISKCTDKTLWGGAMYPTPCPSSGYASAYWFDSIMKVWFKHCRPLMSALYYHVQMD